MSHSQLIQINLPTPITIQNIEEAKAPEVQDGKPAQNNTSMDSLNTPDTASESPDKLVKDRLDINKIDRSGSPIG